ncbi:MAG: hypothetical protein SCM96_08775 [Acidobacteriota bacterium]|nr:hypothetical protein [Acidobacteriota bacterium]
MTIKMISVVTAVAALFAAPALSAAHPADIQTESVIPGGTAGAAPKVFLDWPGVDPALIASDIPFAEFVDSPDEAQVLAAVTSQESDGGREFRLTLSGRKNFLGDENTLHYTSPPGATNEDARKDLAGLLKLGLVRYAAKTPLAKNLTVRFQDQVRPTSVTDPWDFWVFNLSANMFLMGETLYKSTMSYGSLSANRVTPGFKLRTSVQGNINTTRFDFGDSIYNSTSSGTGFSGLGVKSLSEHWSVGAFLSTQSSTYSNIKFGLSAAPAVEFNVFPYSESTQRQLRILYRIGVTRTVYAEETIYLQTSETLFRESLELAFEIKRPWGTAGIEIEGSHYLHDFSKNRIDIGLQASLRIWKGLNFRVSGGYTRVRDQLALPRGGASYEDVLLRRKQLATGYNTYASAGLNFTFGSTKSQVVNPRFGSGSRGFSISM